jgi:hypothetical protein
MLTHDVDIYDVYCIITEINYNSSEQLDSWWLNQLDPMTVHWSQGKNSLHLFDFDTVCNLITDLSLSGILVTRDRIVASRAMELNQMDYHAHWYSINLREKDMEPAVKLAWDHYLMLAGLCK